MPAIKRISSRDNPFYKSLHRISSSARERREAGQTLLDGAHLLRAFLDAGNTPLHLLINEQATQDAEIVSLLDTCTDVAQTQLDDALFAQLSELKTPNGLLALIEIPTAKLEVPHSQFALLLEDIQDPGNLGSILRSAAAAGCDAVFLSTACADAWSPKVLRAGMGGQFVLSIIESADLLKVAADLTGKLSAASLQADKSLYDCNSARQNRICHRQRRCGVVARLAGCGATALHHSHAGQSRIAERRGGDGGMPVRSGETAALK